MVLLISVNYMLNYWIDIWIIVLGFVVILVDGVLLVIIDCLESFNLLIKLVLVGMVDVIEGVVIDLWVKVVCFGGVGCGFSFGGVISVDDVWVSGLFIDIVVEVNCMVCVIVVLL